jgi:hypothetical protein
MTVARGADAAEGAYQARSLRRRISAGFADPQITPQRRDGDDAHRRRRSPVCSTVRPRKAASSVGAGQNNSLTSRHIVMIEVEAGNGSWNEEHNGDVRLYGIHGTWELVVSLQVGVRALFRAAVSSETRGQRAVASLQFTASGCSLRDLGGLG